VVQEGPNERVPVGAVGFSADDRDLLRLVAAVVDAAEQARRAADVRRLEPHQRQLLRTLRVARSRHSSVDPWDHRYRVLSGQLERAWRELDGVTASGAGSGTVASAIAEWCAWLADRVAHLVEEAHDPTPPLDAYARALRALVPRPHEVGSGVSSSVSTGIRAHVRLVERAASSTVDIRDDRSALVR
jgi:hypothetical protein